METVLNSLPMIPTVRVLTLFACISGCCIVYENFNFANKLSPNFVVGHRYSYILFLTELLLQLFYTLLFLLSSYICFKNKLNIPIFVTGILAGLVSITGKLAKVCLKHVLAPVCVITSVQTIRQYIM